MPTRSRPSPHASTRSATSATDADRCADTMAGNGCCHVDTDIRTIPAAPSTSANLSQPLTPNRCRRAVLTPLGRGVRALARGVQPAPVPPVRPPDDPAERAQPVPALLTRNCGQALVEL